MKDKKRIVFHIPLDMGIPATMEVDGVAGPACLAATAKLRSSLAVGAGDGLKRKPDFREVEECPSQTVSR